MKDTASTGKGKFTRLALLGAGAISVGTGGFFAGAIFVAHYLPEKAPFPWGMLAGSLSVGAAASMRIAQIIKDRRDEIDELRQQIKVLKQEVSTAARIRDDCKRESQTLKRQLETLQISLREESKKVTQATKAHESTVAYAQQLDARLVTAGVAIKGWEAKAAELDAQILALQAKITELEADNQEWEDEFEQRLQTLFEEERHEEGRRAREKCQTHYLQLTRRFQDGKRRIIEKGIDAGIAKRLRKFEADYTTVVEERDEALKELRHDRAEFASTISAIKEELDQSAYVEQLISQVEDLQEAIERKDKAILELRSKIVHLEQPRRFAHGSKDNRGNIIIDHALELGMVLDGVYRSRSPDFTRETYHFVTRENLGPKDVVTKLMGNPRHLQADLDAIKPIHFQYNPETLCFEATVELAKKHTTRDDIDRKWLKASKFKALVKGVCAFRVSANKGGSKSPTVRNILGAKLLEGERFEIRRYDPSAGSRKDYWRIAPKWRSYHDAIKMAAEIEALILRRQREKSARNGAEFDWVYFVIDELDNTISTLSGEVVCEGEDEISAAKVVMEAISKAVKEGEHLQIGIIICTQTPNVRQLMKSEVIDKAFFNNMCEIVVEANVFNYLGSSFDQTKSSKLASDYRTVYDWCDSQNEGIEDEARKYRPALYVNKAKRDIIELPMLGEFGFDKLDPAQPYDFDEFNAYEYAGARSLDQALLMASKEQVARTSGIGQAAPNSSPAAPQSAPNLSVGSSQAQPQASSGNVAVIADPRVLTKAEGAPKCPICGDELKSNGKGKGKYKGMKQFACRGRHHTAQMGSKTYYVG